MRQYNTGHWNLQKLNQHERIFYIYIDVHQKKVKKKRKKKTCQTTTRGKNFIKK